MVVMTETKKEKKTCVEKIIDWLAIMLTVGLMGRGSVPTLWYPFPYNKEWIINPY